MFTPERHQFEPCDMAWWSLTCNIAREWRLMMAEAAPVHCSHFQRAIAEFLAFEADNFSTRRTVADIFGCWLPQG